jgi:hypothetical protein
MRTIRLEDFSLWEDGVRVPWPEGAVLRLDDFTFVDPKATRPSPAGTDELARRAERSPASE